MPGAVSVESYHYNEDGQNRGEMTSDVIAKAIQGNPNGKHLVWKQGMSGWTAAEEVDAVQIHLNVPPMPSLPPMPPSGGPPPMP